jgi:putrescine aminotransferase
VLRRWAADARAAGSYVISDEIQTGLGRCGPFCPSIALDLQPDAVLLGKALGGGVMPLSALVATADFYAPIVEEPFLHTSTFSGHPMSCAAGSATLGVVGSLADRGRELARRMESVLAELHRRHRHAVTDVRGRGLLWGVELAQPVAGRVLLELSRQGLLYAPCLDRPEVLRLLPPMVTTDAQLDRAVEALDEACRVAESVV